MFMAGSKVRSLLLKMSRPNTFRPLSSFFSSSFSSFCFVSGDNSFCIWVKSWSFSSYSFSHVVLPCTRCEVVAARLRFIAAVAFLSASASSSVFFPLLVLRREDVRSACSSLPSPRFCFCRSYIFLTRLICDMSTPFCISRVTICDCDVPLAASFCTNSATCESVIDDWAMIPVEIRLRNMTKTMSLFIIYVLYILLRGYFS